MYKGLVMVRIYQGAAACVWNGVDSEKASASTRIQRGARMSEREACNTSGDPVAKSTSILRPSWDCVSQKSTSNLRQPCGIWWEPTHERVGPIHHAMIQYARG